MSFVLRLQKKFKILLFEQRCWFVPKKSLCDSTSVLYQFFRFQFHYETVFFNINIIIAVVYVQRRRPWKHLLTRHDSRHTFFSRLVWSSEYLPVLGFVTHWFRLLPAHRREALAVRSRLHRCSGWSFGHLRCCYCRHRLIAPNFNKFRIFTQICRIITERAAAARSRICVGVARRYAYACNSHKWFNIKTEPTKMCLIGKQFSAGIFTRKLNLWLAADDCTRNR